MKASRLTTLSQLARGATVVGLGFGAVAACTKSGDDHPPHVNAPTTANAPEPSPAVPAAAAEPADAALRPPIMINALPAPDAGDSDDVVPRRRIPVPNAIAPQGHRDGG